MCPDKNSSNDIRVVFENTLDILDNCKKSDKKKWEIRKWKKYLCKIYGIHFQGSITCQSK